MAIFFSWQRKSINRHKKDYENILYKLLHAGEELRFPQFVRRQGPHTHVGTAEHATIEDLEKARAVLDKSIETLSARRDRMLVEIGIENYRRSGQAQVKRAE